MIEQWQSCAKVSTFLHSLPHVLSFLHGPLLKYKSNPCYSFIYYKYAQLLIPWFQKCELQWTATIVYIFLQWNVKYKTDIAVAPAFLSPSLLSEKSQDEYVSNARAWQNKLEVLEPRTFYM